MDRAGFFMRLSALIRKETRQMLRDRSNLIVGFLLPVVLILLFGYGLSFDVTNARLAIVMQENSYVSRSIVAGFEGSGYFDPVWLTSMKQAEAMMSAAEIDGILRVPADTSHQLATGRLELQLLLNGVDSNTAQSIESYVSGALSQPIQIRADRAGNPQAAAASVTAIQRSWFNAAGNSSWFIVPGLVVLVMTLIGAFLTALLIAREWERGTLESLFVTPVRPLELVLSKLAPYLVVGMIDLGVCLLAARVLFDVPFRGALWVILAVSLLYLIVSLLLGLLISAATRNQFAASQMALLTSFMPALMLSGFMFDLRNVPAIIQWISRILPATHFMSLIKTLLLTGNDWAEIAQASAILSVYAVILLLLTRHLLRKKLD